MKKYRGTIILTSLITLLPILAGMLLWDQLPDQIATHFGMDGTPNRWSDKRFAVFGMPLCLLGMHFFCCFFMIMDPKKQNMSDKLRNLILWIIPIISVVVIVYCYGYALGYEWNTTLCVNLFMGMLFLVIGNYLPKCKQNYSMGIRLPWTSHDEENWNHTHRIAGFIWVICGIVLLANIFMGFEWMVFILLAVMVLTPAIYSFLYYKKHGTNKQ